MTAVGSSLFDKLWALHRVDALCGDMDLLSIDLHLLHDLSGPGALKALSERGLIWGDGGPSRRKRAGADRRQRSLGREHAAITRSRASPAANAERRASD